MWGEWKTEPCPNPGTRALPKTVAGDRAEISIQSFVSVTSSRPARPSSQPTEQRRTVFAPG